jgi:hypothetical protein
MAGIYALYATAAQGRTAQEQYSIGKIQIGGYVTPATMAKASIQAGTL